MRIAVPVEADAVSAQFEEAPAFKLYNLEGEKIISTVSVPSFGGGGDGQIDLLRSARADVMVCGGITGLSRQKLAGLGIAVYPGLGGTADAAATAFATGALQAGHTHDCANCKENCGQGKCEHDH